MKYLVIIMLFIVFGFRYESTPEMTLIKGGTFQMGNFEGQPEEKPVHMATVNDFYMAKKELTVKEWKEYINATGKAMPENTLWPLQDNFPMVYVSWQDALEYCNWLSARDKFNPCYKIIKSGNTLQVSCDFKANGYRLPTEAEWEYAARGGALSHNYIYSGGNDLNLVGYYGYNSGNTPHQVGKLRPNELGLYDMSGNAWEWCWDYYDNRYYQFSPKNNPTGPERGTYRVLRGGCLLRNAATCRVTSRYYGVPYNFRGNSNGFRLCRSAGT